MFQFSVGQAQDLLKIIDSNQVAIIGAELGVDFLTEYDKQLLKLSGIDIESLYKPELSSIQTSFHWGMLADALGAFEAKKVTFLELRDYIKSGSYIPVSERQKAVLKSIKTQTFSSLKSLNGKIFSDVNNVLVDKSIAGQMQFLADELKQGISKNQTVTKIAHEIASKTGDWSRNFDRIIETASQTAFEYGKVSDIQRKYPNKDPLVCKFVKQGACKHCIRLYLTNGLGSEPIIFKLSELIANGDNVGRKVNEWKATVGPIHPHCRCSLYMVPDGYIWNSETQSFSTPDPSYIEKTKTKRVLIPVKIGDRIYNV